MLYPIVGSLNLNFKIIDMNLKQFFENTAEKVAEDARDRPHMPQYDICR